MSSVLIGSSIVAFIGILFLFVGFLHRCLDKNRGEGAMILGVIIIVVDGLIGFGILSQAIAVKETTEIFSVNSNMIARSKCFVSVGVDNKIVTSDRTEVYMAKDEQLKVKKTLRLNSYDSLPANDATFVKYEIIVSP